MRFLSRLTSHSAPRILGSDAFGPPMTLTELKAGFVRAKDDPVWRAIGQIALAMREECVETSTKAHAAEKPQLAAMHAGGGNACAEFAQLLADLADGRVPDTVKDWFRDASS